MKRIFIIGVGLIIFFSFTMNGQTKDFVNGNMIQFNDNGFWCWFQDERAVIDTQTAKVVLGSTACGKGVGGSSRNGANDAIIFDLNTRTMKRYLLNQWSGNCDDHNTAAFLVRPDGKYIAMYDQHYDQYVTRYRIYNGTSWNAEQTYDWRTKPGGIDYTLAYNNVYYLSAENLMYNFQRANHRAPNFIVSTNYGDSWTWGGQLTTNTSSSYNKGYYKYWSNGFDRIDFVFTEQHPRDTLTSIYHGYLKDRKAYRSDGVLVDDNIFDTTFIPAYWDFTKVFSDGTVIGNDTMHRCWQADLVRYDNGVIAIIITARTNQFFSNGYNVAPLANPDHAFIYCRYDGSQWSYTYLGKAGLKLVSTEEDYTGLGALCPNDPNVLYISTPYDPRDTSVSLGVREIWKGVTTDNGKTWSWSPITQNSTRDNMRPIVPLWNQTNHLLLWCRGTYTTAMNFDAAVVGIIESDSEIVCKKTYVDAALSNTTLWNGASFSPTGPDSNSNPIDNQWHIRTGAGNEGTVISSSELSAGENAPILKTTVQVPSQGTYNVWVNFWGSTASAADWRVKAGFTLTSMQVYRQMASRSIDSSEYNVEPIIAEPNRFLYEAYLGRINVGASMTFDVFVDDSAVQVGTTTLKGDVNRTWYDGISYSLVGEKPSYIASTNIPGNVKLEQNFPNPFNPLTKICYSVKTASFVTLAVYDVLGREIKTLVNREQIPGQYSVEFDASSYASGVYFYTLRVNSELVATKKMLLIR